MKKILLLLTLFFANCQLTGTEDTLKLDLDSTVQAKYKAEWLQNTASITKENYYNSFFDWYGGGDYNNKVFFDQGYLRAFWDENSAPCMLNELLSLSLPSENEYDPAKPEDWKYDTDLFIDGNTAITVNLILDALFVLQIKDGVLYRTKSSSGFATPSTWDGVTYSTNDLVEVTTQPKE